MTYSWADLAEATNTRQFPVEPALTVSGTVEQMGPIQSQAARAPFIGIAARRSGTTHTEVTAAYEAGEIVRASVIRGTVHTSTTADNRLLEVATRIGQAALMRRSIRLVDTSHTDLYRAIEEFGEQWRTPAELERFRAEWLAARDPAATLAGSPGLLRQLAFGHGGMIRRPIDGRWDGQGKPLYAAARVILADGVARDALQADIAVALDALVLRHLTCHGPATRQDLAWWSGLTLSDVDAALARLAPRLTLTAGPLGRTYADIPQPPQPRSQAGVRLLPEFDATMCAYDPAGRGRYIEWDHHERLWIRNNGQVLPPLMVDGRITGYWRSTGVARRTVDVVYFAGTTRPAIDAVRAAADVVATALNWTLAGVRLTRE